jgi:hypothetical protein
VVQSDTKALCPSFFLHFSTLLYSIFLEKIFALPSRVLSPCNDSQKKCKNRKKLSPGA